MFKIDPIDFGEHKERHPKEDVNFLAIAKQLLEQDKKGTYCFSFYPSKLPATLSLTSSKNSSELHILAAIRVLLESVEYMSKMRAAQFSAHPLAAIMMSEGAKVRKRMDEVTAFATATKIIIDNLEAFQQVDVSGPIRDCEDQKRQ